MGLLKFERLKQSLKRTRGDLFARLERIISLKPVLNGELLAELEEILVSSDVGIATTEMLIENLRRRAREQRYDRPEEIMRILKVEMEELLAMDGSSDASLRLDEKPHVVLIVGVNGVGKTTTIGKLASIYRNAGHRVLIAAGDTFRAASNEQIEVWAQRAGVRLIQQARGADPAAVAFDAVKSALSQGEEVLLIDTAGRLHTNTNLMEELRKIKRVLQKQLPRAPHEVLLVLDATTGQNAIEQAQEFTEHLGVTGLILTKLDGTAKGGILFSISHKLNLPVRYIGVGEEIGDLQPFNKKAFVEALFAN